MTYGTESAIRWCDTTWNPVHGCSKTSEGCRNCYAERVSHKFENTEHPWTVEHTDANIQLKPHFLEGEPGEPGWEFVNSMSDLYHPAVPDAFIEDVYEAIERAPRTVFLILTKHGADTDRDIPPPPENVMLGVSIESPRRQYRVNWLAQQPAETKFISFEPLVEEIPTIAAMAIHSLVDWAIIGGESHPKPSQRRDMDPEWARTLITACRDIEVDVAPFFKQHSGERPEENIEIDVGNGPERIEEFPQLPSGLPPAPREFINRTTLADFGGEQA